MAGENLLHAGRLLEQRGKVGQGGLIQHCRPHYVPRHVRDVQRQCAGGMGFLVRFLQELVLRNALQKFAGDLRLMFEFSKHGVCDGHLCSYEKNGLN